MSQYKIGNRIISLPICVVQMINSVQDQEGLISVFPQAVSTHWASKQRRGGRRKFEKAITLNTGIWKENFSDSTFLVSRDKTQLECGRRGRTSESHFRVLLHDSRKSIVHMNLWVI